MRKIKILSLMLVFVLMFSTVVACGNTSRRGDETGSEVTVALRISCETKH